jgi:DNA-directed RNA polymerase specialized sigma24 family protein
MEGLSSKEIADLLKKSDEATRRLLSDAKKILRETMRPCYQLLNEA